MTLVGKQRVDVLERSLPRREREQVVEDLNLFALLRERLPKGDLRALRSELAQLVASEDERSRPAGEIHPATGEAIAAPEERAQLVFRSLLALFGARRALLEDSLSAPQVAELLHSSRQTPLNRVRANTLLGVQVNGAWRFPAWQFDPAGEDGVLPGLAAVLRALEPQSPFAKLVWLRRPNQSLQAEPLQLLRAGEIERVVDAARAVAELP